MLKISGRQMRRTNRSVVASLVVVGLATVAAGCGTTDEASRETLPPLETTTTTTTTTTTVPLVERFYTVQRGDILAVIASDRGVTVAAIVELNELSSPDAIQAGQVLEIPQNVVINLTESDLP